MASAVFRGIDLFNVIRHAMKKMLLGDTKSCLMVPNEITKKPAVTRAYMCFLLLSSTDARRGITPIQSSQVVCWRRHTSPG